MNILTLEQVSRTLGAKTVFSGVTLGIEDQERIGVIGINGTGKSTLLSILAGTTRPDEGTLTMRNGLRISFLLQDPPFDADLSVLENVLRLAHGDDNGWDMEGEAKVLLGRFGISDPLQLSGQLSGGQKKRAALAAALLAPSDLLILDEPTNHLDHDMIEWLQDYLSHYRGALVMVTHDRYFLDEVTNIIWEIDRKSIYRYEGNYAVYLEKKQERMDFALASERKMAALYKKDLAWMMRGARARSTKQKAHIQRFEALRDREKIVEERNVEMASLASRLGNKTIEVYDLAKSFGDRILFSGFTYTFLRLDRVGIIGPNGCGKSTLLKVILGMIPADQGRVETGQTVRIGYFSQEYEAFPENDRVIDAVRDIAEYIRTPDGMVSASSMCERFLFDSELQYAPISKLSGGEKRRLYLLRILMDAPNVLVLDEPTNDLDIQTLQILEDYLDHFPGIVVCVSHDRYFLDRVVNRIFSFEPGGKLLQSEGGYTEYQYHMQQSSSPLQSNSDREASRTPVSPGKSSSNQCRSDNTEGKSEGRNASSARQGHRERTKTRLSFKEQREYDEIEQLIEELELRSKALDQEILDASADFIRLQSLTEEKARVDAALEEKIERFIELQELVDSF